MHYKTIRVVVECQMEDSDDEERKPWSSPLCKNRAREIVWKAIHEYADRHQSDRSRTYPVYGDNDGRTFTVISDQKFFEPEVIE